MKLSRVFSLLSKQPGDSKHELLNNSITFLLTTVKLSRVSSHLSKQCGDSKNRLLKNFMTFPFMTVKLPRVSSLLSKQSADMDFWTIQWLFSLCLWHYPACYRLFSKHSGNFKHGFLTTRWLTLTVRGVLNQLFSPSFTRNTRNTNFCA